MKGSWAIVQNPRRVSIEVNQDMSYEYLCDDTRATEGNNRYPISVPLNSDVTNESIIDKLCKYLPVGQTISNNLGLTALCKCRDNE